MAVKCAAMIETLLEAELSGIEERTVRHPGAAGASSERGQRHTLQGRSCHMRNSAACNACLLQPVSAARAVRVTGKAAFFCNRAEGGTRTTTATRSAITSNDSDAPDTPEPHEIDG